MKKLAIAIAVLLILAGFASYNVWRANQDPVTAPPGPLEMGRQQLQSQLKQSEQREAEIEKQDWDSVPLLRDLMSAHQHRIDQLSGNAEAAEIVAHDREAMARLQKRIDEIIAQQSATPPQPQDGNPTVNPPKPLK